MLNILDLVGTLELAAMFWLVIPMAAMVLPAIGMILDLQTQKGMV